MNKPEPTDTDLVELCELAVAFAKGAGDVLVARAGHARTDIETKSSAVDLVTDADRAAEAFLVAAIREQRPDDGIIGEEGTNDMGTSGIVWIIDPLDGTTNFVYGIPMFAVSVGATIGSVPVAGAVYNPMLDEMYSASRGNGAFLNGRPIRCNDIDLLATALVATGFSYESDKRALQASITASLMPDIRDIRRAGAAALDMCNVATGRVDAYFEHYVRPWDVAAGTVIAREAGALVASLDGNEPREAVIAAAPGIFDALSRRIFP